MYRALLPCVLLFACAQASTSDEPSDTVDDPGPGLVEPIAELDVAYGEADSAVLDLYYVPDDTPKRLMVFVHGGSWISGDKGNLATTEAAVAWFQDRDFVVAAPNFRTASPPNAQREVGVADMASDIAQAVAWLEAEGPAYGVTEPEVVLVGYSSGAHLVALLGADPSYLQAAGADPSRLHATVSLDVHAYDVPYALSLMEGSEIAQNDRLIRWLFGEGQAEQLALSPIAHASAAYMPRTLLLSAESSSTPTQRGYISREASRRYADHLEGLGQAATHVHYDGETHSSLMMDLGTEGDEPTAELEAFLSEE